MGRTKSYEWRIAQLKAILNLVDENEDEITDALYQDISKPPFESFISEVDALILIAFLILLLVLIPIPFVSRR